jgi:hypothetical protein
MVLEAFVNARVQPSVWQFEFCATIDVSACGWWVRNEGG